MTTFAAFSFLLTSGISNLKSSKALRKSILLCLSMLLCKLRFSEGSASLSLLLPTAERLLYGELLDVLYCRVLLTTRDSGSFLFSWTFSVLVFRIGNMVFIPFILFLLIAVAIRLCICWRSLTLGFVGREHILLVMVAFSPVTETTSISSSVKKNELSIM